MPSRAPAPAAPKAAARGSTSAGRNASRPTRGGAERHSTCWKSFATSQHQRGEPSSMSPRQPRDRVDGRARREREHEPRRLLGDQPHLKSARKDFEIALLCRPRIGPRARSCDEWRGQKTCRSPPWIRSARARFVRRAPLGRRVLLLLRDDRRRRPERAPTRCCCRSCPRASRRARPPGGDWLLVARRAAVRVPRARRNPLLQSHVAVTSGVRLRRRLPAPAVRAWRPHHKLVGGRFALCVGSWVAAVSPGIVTAETVATFDRYPYDGIIFGPGCVCRTTGAQDRALQVLPVHARERAVRPLLPVAQPGGRRAQLPRLSVPSCTSLLAYGPSRPARSPSIVTEQARSRPRRARGARERRSYCRWNARPLPAVTPPPPPLSSAPPAQF